MRKDKFGQKIYSPEEIFDIAMRDLSIGNREVKPGPFLTDDTTIDIAATNRVAGYEALEQYNTDESLSVEEFDRDRQSQWFMPESYKQFDIAAYVLSLCRNEAELQRCGEELLLYAERELLDVLRYMKYLVDTMELNNVIWGVGRGSSVASYVLYKLKVHKIDSMFYQLDPKEFLR